MKKRSQAINKIVKDMLIFLMGAAVTLRIECGGGQGEIMILPMIILLVFIGWQMRGLIDGCKK